MRFGSPMIAAPAAASRRWYEFRAEENKETADLYIYDVIDSYWGVNAEDFIKDLKSITASTIIVHLNTPGGYVFDGLAIYNALKQHPAKIVTMIDGYAASMGSIIALAGDEVKIASSAFVMIHNPWVVAIGDANDMRETADFLDKIKVNMIAIYGNRMNKTADEISAIMDKETWYSAAEALEVGFATEIVNVEDESKSSYHAAILGYKNVPEKLKAKIKNQPEPAVDDPEQPENSIVLKARIRSRLEAMQLDDTKQAV